MVDASLAGNKFGCVFKLNDQEAQQFLSAFLDDLKNSIKTIGYECDYLTCMTSNIIKETQEDYHRELFSERCAINILA
jgi:hypothetical protein